MVAEQIRLTFQNIRLGWIGLIILASFIAYAANGWSALPPWWWLALLLSSLAHGFLTTKFHRLERKKRITRYRRWGYSMVVLSLLVGVVISIGAILALQPASHEWTYFLMALLIMPGFGSAVTSGAFLWIHVAWIVGTQLPFALWLICFSPPSLAVFGWLMLLPGIPIMILFGIGYGRIYRRNIQLYLRNIELLEDLEERRRTAEAISQEKTRFLAAASHDLRQPLHALDLFLGALHREITAPEQHHLLEKAIQSSRALGVLLESLLDLSRIDSGRVVPHKETFRLSPIIDEIASEFPQHTGDPKRRIRTHISPALSTDSDPVLLGCMLRNLIINAARHATGDVLIGARRRGDTIHIEIYDQGDGIPEDQQHAVFSEFYQLNNPERDRDKGIGLGLSIVRRLSQLLDHPVLLRSMEGKGCRFTVVVPQAPHHVPSQSPEPPSPADDLTGIFILAIDDDALVRDGLRLLLRTWKCEVLTAESTEAALAVIHRDNYPPPDVVLADYRLRNGETGLDAIRTVRAHFGTDIRGVVITGDSTPEIKEQCRHLGYLYLAKPLNHEQLKGVLAKTNRNLTVQAK